MKIKKGIVSLGIVTVLLWASYTPYLIPLPFSLQPSVKKIAKNIAEAPESVREKAGFSGKSQSEIERTMMKKVVLIWLLKAIPILIGILSGLFLIRRKNYGRIMAVLVAMSWILLNFMSYIRSANIWERLYATYVTSLKENPRFIIHNDILPFIVFVLTICYLLQPSVGRDFKTPSK